MSEAKEKVCPRCKTRFECFAPRRCWCHSLPPLRAPVVEGPAAPGAATDCLCPKCLAAEAESQGHPSTTGVRNNALGGTGVSPVGFGVPPKPPSDAAIANGIPRTNDRGFTLVELLVTVAIIAILAAMLLPALSDGKAQGQSAKCISNLHQFGVAAQLYWDDNQGNTFAFEAAPSNSGTTYWFGWLAQGAEGARAFDPTLGALYPYLRAAVSLCPAFDYASSQFKLKATGPTCDYGYNLNFSPLGQPPINIKKLTVPASTAVLGDAAQVNTFEPPASPRNPMFEEWYYVNYEGSNSPPQPNGQFRHQKRANVLFSDLHVGQETMVAGSLDTRLPNEMIGWLRPEILTAR